MWATSRLYEPAAKIWKEWKLPGTKPQAYAVWVDESDKIWVSEWSANAVVRFDPATETFEGFPSDRPNAEVRQMLRPQRGGLVTAKKSGTERIRVIRYGGKTK